MLRDDVLKQLDRWTEMVREEALALYDKGVEPIKVVAIAITIADSRLSHEVNARRLDRVMPLTGPVRIPPS